MSEFIVGPKRWDREKANDTFLGIDHELILSIPLSVEVWDGLAL